MTDKEQKDTGSFKPMDELLKTWDRIKSMTRIALTGKVAPDIVGIDEEHIKKQIHQCLYAKGGEILGRTRAVELVSNCKIKRYVVLSWVGGAYAQEIKSFGV